MNTRCRILLAATSVAMALSSSSILLAQVTTQPAGAGGAGVTAELNAPTTQRATTHVSTTQGGGIMLNFKDASIDSVLDELSSVAGFIVVKEVKPEGKVTLVSKQPVNASDAISLLNTVMKNANLTAIQQGRILKIVARDAAKRANIPVRVGADPKQIEPTDELITQVIPLKQTDAVALKQDLQPLINPLADFAANQASNALVITDTAANIRRVVEIVAALDNSLVGAAEVKVFQLKYATAAGAARLINDLFGQNAQARGQQSGDQPRFGFGGFGGFGGFPGAPGGSSSSGRDSRGGNNQQQGRQAIKINASSDDRTNTVVVTGPPETLEIIEKVVKEIDANPAAEETVFVYRLRNGDAYNVESVVNTLFNSTGGSGSRGVGGSSGSYRSSTSGGLRGNNRSSSSSTNGFMGNSRVGGGGLGSSSGSGGLGSSSSGGFGGSSRLGGTTGGFGGIGGFGGFTGGGLSSGSLQSAAALANQVSVIADADTNSLLVRTSPKNYEQVKGILEELDRPVAQVLIKVLIAEITHDNSLDYGAEFSVLNLRAGGLGQQGGTNYNLPAPASIAQGAVVQILENDFTATIRALETAGKLDVLSRPYILASDNQLATITVGQEIAFITRSQLTEDGTTNNTIQYDDIGILLDVIPHINPDGLVILDVAPEISALTGNSTPISDTVSAPTIAKRSAQSRVAVPNGQTIVIGGLMEDRKTSTINKVPILGSIPIIGEAFKHTSIVKSKTELLIFLTPHVAAQPNLLKTMGQDEMDGTKLVPNAVDPGAFQEHMRGMIRGATTTPSAPVPPVVPEKQ